MISTLVHDFLEHAAQARPEAVLAVEPSGPTAYGVAERGSNRVAHALRDQGIRRGDRVALLAANGATYIEGYYGVLKSGSIVVSLNVQGDPRAQAEILQDCAARGMICGPGQIRQALRAAELANLEFVLAWGSPPPKVEPAGFRLLPAEQVLPAMPEDPPRPGLIDLDRAAIVYTSGSTGKARGAILSHLNLVSNTRSIVQYLGLTSDDSVMVVLPFHYVYGKSLLNTHVAVGGRVIIENRFMFPQLALNTLEQEAATGFAGVPSTFAILLNKSNLAERELPCLRYVTQAGGAMAPTLQRRLIEALPGKQIFIMYGATEASARLSFLPPADLPRKLGSIGTAIPNVDLRVLRDDGSEAAVDEVGEIVARGSNIMEGYWNAPQETAEVLDAHGYHTGDLGQRDADGFLYVVGRKREMIKSGAHRISPKEIEELLAEHPAVHEIAVFGLPDELLGEAIVACATLRPGSTASAESMQDWCKERIAAYKVPHQVIVLSEMPRNASGKIDKLVLAQRTQRG